MAKSEELRQLLLRIDSPEMPTRLEDLLRARYTIGRGETHGDQQVDFRIEADHAVSRLHCMLVREGDGYVLRNQSRNGTEVNGKLVEGNQVLKPGDVLRIGDGTRIEYLALTKAQRSRAFAQLTSGTTKEEPEEGVRRKSLIQQPWFLGMLAFYGIIGYALLGIGGDAKTSGVSDPGKGPYFNWLLERPLREGEPAKIKDARAIAQRMWDESWRRYGGPGLEKPGNAFRLLLRGREVLRVLGYRTVAEAKASEDVAATMLQLQTDLEGRVAGNYARYKEQRKDDEDPEVLRGTLKRVMRDVPKSDEPIHAYVVDQLTRLRKARGKKRGRGRARGRRTRPGRR